VWGVIHLVGAFGSEPHLPDFGGMEGEVLDEGGGVVRDGSFFELFVLVGVEDF